VDAQKTSHDHRTSRFLSKNTATRLCHRLTKYEDVEQCCALGLSDVAPLVDYMAANGNNYIIINGCHC